MQKNITKNIKPITRVDLPDVDKLHGRSFFNALNRKQDIVPIDFKKIVEEQDTIPSPVEECSVGILFNEAAQNPKIIMSAYRTGTKLKGFVTAGPSDDQDYAEFCEMHCLYIDPKYFRKGIGTALFKYAANTMAEKGFKDMFVVTLAKDDRSNSFYKKMGGKRDGQIKPHPGYNVVCNRYLWEL